MADREMIAAILTAGMLPTLEIPQSRTGGRSGVTRAEGEAIQNAVDHAFGIYRLILNGLRVDPIAFAAEPDGQRRTPAAGVRNGATGLPGHDSPRSEEPASQASRSVGAALDLRDSRGIGASMSNAGLQKWAQAQEVTPSISLMITQEQKTALRKQGYNEQQIREMKPEDAHRALAIVD